ncbi:type 4 prepilin peptidase 1 [Cytobacillus oceanisediminis]|jgi:leader peptidase (prepilin peptidase)/N-methyltransferase|uniref:Type 4 prepilin peptidase 1 n=1 Tax=Cytobacillus oceanisediminis TaxID=665099 RepID=A0A2V2ZIB2_9BACI|nr:A24 family peptidase [Cytobacillus oceanisediminis]PWW19649.1 type 4 prepilin peptidase 1 [Cytobacillus oceanisediminis]
MLLIYLYLFVLGAVLGSFYNVVGLRVPLKKSIVAPRSHCPVCLRNLTAGDLVPIFSYIWLKGKCRRCGTSISPVYPLIELATGLLFVFTFYQIGFNPELIVALTFISLLVIIFVSDIVYMIIPDKVLLFFLPILMLERIVVPLSPWWDSTLGAFAGFLLLFAIAVISKGGMGGGDIKLYFLIGIVLGFKLTMLSFFLATLAGAVYGFGGMLLGKYKKRQPVPFGPFIAAGAILAYFYGEEIIDWYFTSFLM